MDNDFNREALGFRRMDTAEADRVLSQELNSEESIEKLNALDEAFTYGLLNNVFYYYFNHKQGHSLTGNVKLDAAWKDREDTPEEIENLEKINRFLEEKLGGKIEQGSNELAILLTGRALGGRSSYLKDLKAQRNKRNNETYLTVKDRESVKNVIELRGKITSSVSMVINTIAQIDKTLGEGGSYEDAFTSYIYSDTDAENHAFLSHVEEKFNTIIKTPHELSKLAGLKEQPSDDVDNCFYLAQEDRISMAMKKTLDRGGKYSDLLAFKCEDFYLPIKWDGMREDSNMGTITARVIRSYFHTDDNPNLTPKDLMENLDVDYPTSLHIFSELH